MVSSSRFNRRRSSSTDIWPGFVDVLSTLLLVMIFLLVVYMLAQYFLQRTVTGQNEALNELSRQVGELTDLLALERRANADLRINIAQLSAEMQNSTLERDRLSNALAQAVSDRDTLQLRLRDMTGEAQAALAEAAEADSDRTAALLRAEVGEEKLRLLLSEAELLRRDIDALKTVRADLEAEVSQMAAVIEAHDGEIAELREEFTAARDRSAKLEAALASEAERTSLAQSEVETRDIRLAELQNMYLQTQSELTDVEDLSTQQQDQIAMLSEQIQALRQQLLRIENALDISESKTKEQDVVIADLGRRLNLALAAKVEELASYRSEFFGRLREVLSDRTDFTIIGDRFVFQSEVLFGSGSDLLGDTGKDRLTKFATILQEVMARIPNDLPWILQVDGHTDVRPIQTARFPSNWELSSARAISVVNHLIQGGIPPQRLSATGYGEFQPIDERNDEIAYRRNRRIELKLTQR